MYDTIITGGTVVDGTGTAPYDADVAITDGRIVEIGEITGEARERIDATGALVTPGWVDVHTHYDGQVTWDDAIEPSAANGVTTLVMGNCGVGFAPVRPTDHAALIDLMEGVEDIPGSALSAGMPWGEWETFEDYLNLLETRTYAVDISTQVAHGAVRFYVMGERGRNNEDATAEDLEAMAAIVRNALDAGAVGFTTSRTIGHRSKSGVPVPGTFAAEEELLAIAEAMRDAGHGVFEGIVAGSIGTLEQLGGEKATMLEELPLLRAVAEKSGRPVTFSLAQLFDSPDLWREVMDVARASSAEGNVMRPQILPRSVTLMTSLDAYHLFMFRPTYLGLKDLPLAERVTEMRRPEIRDAILAETDKYEDQPNGAATLMLLFNSALPVTFPLSDPVNYEPSFDDSVFMKAMTAGIEAQAYMYDQLLEQDGKAFYAALGSNFAGGNLEVCREMLLDTNTVTGLSDAGAHVNLISDCSSSTFHLTHWGRDRTAGELLPIELLVHKMSGDTAALYGFDDRGTLEVGKRADVNVIDFERLRILAPELRHDLPAGASRILQGAEGYVATLVNGVVTRRNDVDTGERPGRLVRAS
jgi:N-acyl-D-aspartate/D-glutamate deacylase